MATASLAWAACALPAGAFADARTQATGLAAEGAQAPSQRATAMLFDGLVADVARLRQALRPAESLLQLGTAPASKQGTRTSGKASAQSKTGIVKRLAMSASKGARKSAQASAQSTTGAGKSAVHVEAGHTAGKGGFDAQTALKEMGTMGPAQMKPMLGLLKGMYADWKEKISAQNKKEQDAKKEYAATLKDLEAKKAKVKNDVNGTAMYDRIEKYWKRQREISHRQYHTALKLMHSGMSKMKTMIGAYQDAIGGKKPSQKTLHVVEGMPEVVLLQQQAVVDLVRWANSAWATLQDVRKELPE